MFLSIVIVHWIGYLVALAATGHFLYTHSYPHFILIGGFYIISQGAKLFGEYMMMKKKEAYMQMIRSQAGAVQNVSQQGTVSKP